MGKRVKDVTGTQTTFIPSLVFLVDKVDTGSGDWLTARKMELGLLGNTRFQGSNNNVNWHDIVEDNDEYFRFSTDNGTNWKSLNTNLIREDINLYFTEARVLAISGVADAITATHIHTNWDALQGIVDNGDGNSFLTNNGSYFNVLGGLTLNTIPVKGAIGFSNSPVFVDGTSVKIGDVTNNVEFEADGTIKFNGTSTYWRDIDFPIIIRTTGANIPVLTTINGNLSMPLWAVNDFSMCESQELVHEWKEGSTVYWHLHLTTNGLDASNRYVRFELEYGYAKVDGTWVFPTAIDTGDLLIPANTATKTMMVMSLGNFTPTGIEIAGHVIARLKRIAASGTAPTNNPWIPMLQLHILCDTIGSREMITK